MRIRVVIAVLAGLALCTGMLQLEAQDLPFSDAQGKRVASDTALTNAMKTSSLTDEGKPFHAVLEIGDKGSPYSGQIEIWWAGGTKSKTVIASPGFSQVRIVNGTQTMETNSGDYYPRWLETFVDGLLDPVPMMENFRGRGGAVVLGPHITRSCLSRDDRPGGITDQLTLGMVCFNGAGAAL